MGWKRTNFAHRGSAYTAVPDACVPFVCYRSQPRRCLGPQGTPGLAPGHRGLVDRQPRPAHAGHHDGEKPETHRPACGPRADSEVRTRQRRLQSAKPLLRAKLVSVFSGSFFFNPWLVDSCRRHHNIWADRGATFLFLHSSSRHDDGDDTIRGPMRVLNFVKKMIMVAGAFSSFPLTESALGRMLVSITAIAETGTFSGPALPYALPATEMSRHQAAEMHSAHSGHPARHSP